PLAGRHGDGLARGAHRPLGWAFGHWRARRARFGPATAPRRSASFADWSLRPRLRRDARAAPDPVAPIRARRDFYRRARSRLRALATSSARTAVVRRDRHSRRGPRARDLAVFA